MVVKNKIIHEEDVNQIAVYCSKPCEKGRVEILEMPEVAY